MTIEIDISCSDSGPKLDVRKLLNALEHGLQTEGVDHAVLSVTVVDNDTIHRLNRDHLRHDYPTDVLSFPLEWRCSDATIESRSQLSTRRSAGATIEGEIVVSWEYAAEMAPRCGWSAEHELTLYAIHGMLHICGYDDLTVVEKHLMRSRERAILQGLGLNPQYPDDVQPDNVQPDNDEPPGQRQSRMSGRKTIPEDRQS